MPEARQASEDDPRRDDPGSGPESGTPEAAGEISAARDGPPGGGEGEYAGEPSGDGEGDRTGDEELAEEIAGLQERLAELNDRYLRLAAEFDNFRKRSRSEQGNARIRSQIEVVRGFLDVLDDLERVRAVDLETASPESLLEGVEMVERKFHHALQEAGVEVVDPTDDPFDPGSMEAVLRVPAESEEDDDRVHEVFQKGYRMEGHLIRPARVSVQKHD